MSQSTRDKVFISYSHQDKAWLQSHFLKHLKPHLRNNPLADWDDSQIASGTRWSEEIQKAIDTACVAVLILSPDFLVSEFIINTELPWLLEAAKGGGLQIHWLHYRPCAWQESIAKDIQGLHDTKFALSELDESERERGLVEICQKIKAALVKSTTVAPPPPPSPQPSPLSRVPLPVAAEGLRPLRSFSFGSATIGFSLVDPQDRLWVSTGQQVKILQSSSNAPRVVGNLPKRRWKQAAAVLWSDGWVMSDWDGGLWRIRCQFEQQRIDSEVVYEAHYDELPVHRLAVGPQGELVTAAWDGTVRTWTADGQLAAPQQNIQLPYLPLFLVPLFDRCVVVADQGRCVAVADQGRWLRVFDAAGNEQWSYRANGAIENLWVFGKDHRRDFVAQIGSDTLIKIRAGTTMPEEHRFAEPVRACSRRDDEWIVLARAGGRIDWFSVSRFEVIQDYCVAAKDFEIREIHAVKDPRQPARLIAVGLTDQNQMFSVSERDVRRHPTTQPIRRLILDHAGNCLFAVRDPSDIDVFQNPAMDPV